MVARIIYDIGANDGADTGFYLAKGFKVIAVEADPALCDKIGKQYHLQVLGKNFEVGTTITFGEDVQVIGLPFVASPTTAYVDVLVSLAAVAGVRPATATNKEGTNVGPGGVFVGPLLPDPVAKGKKKKAKKPTPTPTPAE